jgi:hypothetical protein
MPLLREVLEHCQGRGFKSRERKLYSVGAGGCKLRRSFIWGWDSFDGAGSPPPVREQHPKLHRIAGPHGITPPVREQRCINRNNH